MPGLNYSARGLLWPALAISLTLIIAGLAPVSAKEKNKAFIPDPVSPKQSVRFYKANKRLQADRVQLTGGETPQTGCQNLLKKTRIFKVLQIGYKTCSLYELKDCDVSSLVPVQSEDQLHSSYLLTEGVGWLPQGEDERGVKIGSWSCEMVLTEGEMRAEKALAYREVSRLTREQQASKKKLEAAQKEFDQAKKAKNKAGRYAKKVKAEAIAMGAIEPDPEPEDEEKEGDKKDAAKDQE